MMIIDGYNLIYESDELKALAHRDLEASRERLVEMLINYSAATGREVEVVFDAASRRGPSRSVNRSRNLKVTFTAGGQSADSYIEKLAYRLARSGRENVVAVTGDYNQQKVTGGAGLLRMSSREFLEEVGEARRPAERGRGEGGSPALKVRLEKRIPDDVREALLRIRRRDRE